MNVSNFDGPRIISIDFHDKIGNIVKRVEINDSLGKCKFMQKQLIFHLQNIELFKLKFDSQSQQLSEVSIIIVEFSDLKQRFRVNHIIDYYIHQALFMDMKLLAKKQLVSWINNLLSINIRCIEELSNGAAFCQLVDFIHPSTRIKKVNWNAKLQHQNLANLKILSVSMMEAGLNKNFDATRIANKKGQDILELLQWFRKYFHNNKSSVVNSSYEPKAHRASLQPNTKRNSIDCIRVPSTLSISKPLTSQKKQSESEGAQNLANCLKVNKAIERIVFDQGPSPNLKIQMIKSILFKGNTNELEKTQQTPNNAKTPIKNLMISKVDSHQTCEQNKTENQVLNCIYNQSNKKSATDSGCLIEKRAISMNDEEVKLEEPYQLVHSFKLDKSDRTPKPSNP